MRRSGEQSILIRGQLLLTNHWLWVSLITGILLSTGLHYNGILKRLTWESQCHMRLSLDILWSARNPPSGVWLPCPNSHLIWNMDHVKFKEPVSVWWWSHRLVLINSKFQCWIKWFAAVSFCRVLVCWTWSSLMQTSASARVVPDGPEMDYAKLTPEPWLQG